MMKLRRLLSVLVLIVAAGFMMGGACDDDDGGSPLDTIKDVGEDVCGPCGTVANGDATITGMASLDGVFKALGTLKMTTGKIKGNFDARVRAMAEGIFDIDVTGKATADLVAEIKTSFSAMVAANVDGSISVKYEPPKCQASLDVAVQAKAQCTAKVDANCSAEVECDPGKLSFKCEGKCEGSCEGTCDAPSCSVSVTPGTLKCDAECRGGCAVEVSGECSGKCEGECSGECSAYVKNAEGEAECSGSCSGTCTGKCEVDAKAECSGECRGECVATGPEATASCEAPSCEGSCEGSCSGGCEGEIQEPKCEGSAECNAEASAECEAQASAQASASLECTPPSLALDYNFKAGVTAEAQAEFLAKLDKFRVEMVGIIQGMAQLRALVDASAAAELGIEPPTVKIQAALQAFLDDVTAGNIDIAVGLLPCAAPAFKEAITIVGSLATDMQATISAQISLVGLLNIS